MLRISRRQWLAGAAASTGLFGVAACVDAQQEEFDFERSRKAVARGLAYLARQQDESGAFTVSHFGREPAIVALAGLALMASGHTPDRGVHGRRVARCVDFLLQHSRDSGLIAIDDSSTRGPMYGHGFATLFLAEACGMIQREELRDKLSRAVKLIVDAQNDEGGWRYEPHSREADISVTVCQVMAMRAAKNAGMFVPKLTVDRAIEYVRRSQKPDGGFMYTLQDRGPSAFARTGAGIVALHSAGVYEGPEIESGLKYLMDYLPGAEKSRAVKYYFYGHYYAAQAMHRRGGEFWRRWYPAIQKELLARQNKDGYWRDVHGPEYATAMACIVLQTPNNFLPAFQK